MLTSKDLEGFTRIVNSLIGNCNIVEENGQFNFRYIKNGQWITVAIFNPDKSHMWLDINKVPDAKKKKVVKDQIAARFDNLDILEDNIDVEEKE